MPILLALLACSPEPLPPLPTSAPLGFTGQAWLELQADDDWICLELRSDGTAYRWWGHVDRDLPRGPWPTNGGEDLGPWSLLDSSPGWGLFAVGERSVDVVDLSTGADWTQRASALWEGGSLEHTLYQPTGTFDDGVCTW